MQTPHARNLPPINTGWRVGIVASSYYEELIAELIRGAENVLLGAGLPRGNVRVFRASGSFEIPLIGNVLAAEKHVDALIGLGIIVQGETHHAQLLAEETARGMMQVQLTHGVPFAFEVLFVDSLAQAEVRCRGEDNKGAEAASAVLHSLATLERLRS
jgi:6,7-dimethyl-8-ribityllumazine synthase